MFSGCALRTRRILHGVCMVFACGTACAFFCMWNSLHGFCMTRTACTVLRGFCMWNSLHGFCMTRTACTVLRGFCMWNSLHGFCMTRTACTVLHVMWLNPVPLPCFFPVRPYVGSSWRTSLRGRAVPSGHLGSAERALVTSGHVPSWHSAERALVTKCAELAQCRAGTSN